MLNLRKFTEGLSEIKPMIVDTNQLGYALFSTLQGIENLLELDIDKISFEEIDSAENVVDPELSEKMKNLPEMVEKICNLKVKKCIRFF